MAWYDPTTWFDDSTPAVDYTSSNYLETLFGDAYKPGGATVYGDQVLKGELPDGSIAYSNGIVMKPNGDVVVNGELFGNTNTDGSGTLDTSLAGTLGTALSQFGTSALSGLKSLVTNPSTGKIDAAKLAGIAGGIIGGTGLGGNFFQQSQKPVGYTGGIPEYTAVREQVPQTYDPNRRPGSRGQEYFTDVQYAKPDQVATAKATAAQQATEAEARNKARAQPAPPSQEYAAGGIANLAQGRYLSGATDGMADKIPATIANQQPAKLSHGEFVIPADVVSHLGNGNSEAGANRLYGMMDKVRKARTGTTKQGKQINPNKFMPG